MGQTQGLGMSRRQDFQNRDVMADPVPDVESLETCQAACRADDGCEGVEWYPDTEGW